MRVRLRARWAAELCAALLVLQGTSASAADPRAPDELARKAAAFRAALVERHLAPEGVVLYRANLETFADDLEHGTYPGLADTPMFTGQLAAAACTRADLEDDPAEALSDAARALDGLELLTAVTGRRGLRARGIRRDRGRDPGQLSGKWLPAAPPYQRYVFRADVSADQYASGLLPAIAACAHLFPERARRLATGFAAHLLEHDMRLVDADGKQTRFGDLSWRSGLGLNSIYQLTGYAAFALAASLDPDPALAQERDRLRDHYRIPARGRTTNVRIGRLTNYSNDLMAWNLYRVLIPLARASGDPALADLRHGMWRAWLRTRGEGNAYFVAVRCWIEPETCDRDALREARELLRAFPLDKRKLAPRPELARLPRSLLRDRKWRPQARHIVPIELRPASSFEWKSSPYRVTGRAYPEIEYSGVDFLTAYWLLRAAEERVMSRDANPPTDP